MFFKIETLSINILDVLELKQKEVNLFNSGRNFNALSFRYRADTILKTNKKEYYLSDDCVSFVPARLDYNRNSKVDEMIVIHFDTTTYCTQEIESFVPKNPAVLSRLFSDILQCWNQKEIGYKYRCSAILYEILAECYTHNFVSKSSDSIIQNSINFILNHYSNSDISMQEIASKSFMSEVYFRKIFKKEYGVSPQKYIIQLRIQKAAGLISSGYYSLKEVALMSGYTDYKYFSAEFKRIQGVSPSNYSYNFSQQL